MLVTIPELLVSKPGPLQLARYQPSSDHTLLTQPKWCRGYSLHSPVVPWDDIVALPRYRLIAASKHKTLLEPNVFFSYDMPCWSVGYSVVLQ